MARNFSPAFCQQFFDENGKPLAAGKLYTYVAGSSTPVATYKAITGGAMNTNPIILDAAGYADFVLELGASYKFVLKDKNDVFKKQWDNVTAADISETLEQLVTDIEGKADKANPATNGHLAELTSDGNLKDSGYNPSDFATKEQGEKADTAYQKPEDGIPKSDMSQDVKDSLDKADSAIQANDLIKFVRVDQRQNFSENERRNGRRNITASQGIINGANWPIDTEDLLQIYVDLYFDTLGLYYERDVGGGGIVRGKSCSLVPQANGHEYGKILFVMPRDHTQEGDDRVVHHLEYLSILQACANRSETKLALARGQVPIEVLNGTKNIPSSFLEDGTRLYPMVFTSEAKDPMNGDVLGVAYLPIGYDSGRYYQCEFGKPYGINTFEYEITKWNEKTPSVTCNLLDTAEVWRQIPFDKDVYINKLYIASHENSFNKSWMKGIYELAGDSVTLVSDATEWGNNMYYLHQPKEAFSRVGIVDNNNTDATPVYIFEFTLPDTIRLQAGKNYLFPCATCDNTSDSGKGPILVTYKDASPALPWETLWVADNNGEPVKGQEAYNYCCRASVLGIKSQSTNMYFI